MADKEPKGDYVKEVKYKRKDDTGIKRFVVAPMRRYYYWATQQEDPRKERVSA